LSQASRSKVGTIAPRGSSRARESTSAARADTASVSALGTVPIEGYNEMKKNLHPKVRQIVFKDVSSDFSFLGTSTLAGERAKAGGNSSEVLSRLVGQVNRDGTESKELERNH
jgi:hypothetical protein